MMQEQEPAAARWLAEALETGNSLGALPPDAAPRNTEEGEAIAFAVLERLGFVPCGLRLAGGGVVGPVLQARLIQDRAPVALAMVRHARVTAAAIGVLAAPLDADGEGAPVFSTLHPALDIAAHRFTEMPSDPALVAADLGGLGLVVAGRGKRSAPGLTRVALGPPESRARGVARDLAADFDRAAAEARRLGGLPTGGLLVVTGLSEPVRPESGAALVTRIAGLGRAEARFAG